MIRFNHNHKNDYDKLISYGESQIGCYSEQAMKKLFPEKGYKIAGTVRLSSKQLKKIQENAEKTKKPTAPEKHIGEFHMGKNIFPVFDAASPGLFAKTQGYVCVGGDTFLLIKQSIGLFVGLLSSMSAGIVLCIVLIILMLQGGDPSPEWEIKEHPLPPVDPNVESFDETETEIPGGSGLGTDSESETFPYQPPESGDPGYPGVGGDPSESDPPEIDPPVTDPSETDPRETDPQETEPVETDPVGSDERETESAPKESEASPDETQPSEDGGSVSMIYTRNARYTAGEKNVSIYFKNPSRSDHDALLEFYAIGTEGQRVLMAKSGRIPAGMGLDVMRLEDSAPQLAPGSYRGLYRVLYYDPKTGERAIITSELPDIIITVQ